MDKQSAAATGSMGNRYKIISTESSSRLSIHYGAFDLFTGKIVSITAVSKRRTTQPGAPYALTKLRSDCAFCVKVIHPDILHVYDQFDDEDYLYLVAEYSGAKPISDMDPALPRPDAGSFIAAMQKVVYAVEYYHSNQTYGCFIRPQHVRLLPTGDVQLDHLMDCRLSYLCDITDARAKTVMSNRDDAIAVDLEMVGEIMALLIREMPKPVVAMDRRETVLQESLPRLTNIAERLKAGAFADIGQVSHAMHDIETRMRGELDRISRAFPARTQRRKLAAGEVLFREGEFPNDEAFIVERGVIQISKAGSNGREIYLDVSKTGDIVGEMALIDSQPRMATARALEPTTLVVITKAEFRHTLEKMDNVGRRLISVLAARLRFQAKEVTRLKALIGIGR